MSFARAGGPAGTPRNRFGDLPAAAADALHPRHTFDPAARPTRRNNNSGFVTPMSEATETPRTARSALASPRIASAGAAVEEEVRRLRGEIERRRAETERLLRQKREELVAQQRLQRESTRLQGCLASARLQEAHRQTAEARTRSLSTARAAAAALRQQILQDERATKALAAAERSAKANEAESRRLSLEQHLQIATMRRALSRNQRRQAVQKLKADLERRRAAEGKATRASRQDIAQRLRRRRDLMTEMARLTTQLRNVEAASHGLAATATEVAARNRELQRSMASAGASLLQPNLTEPGSRMSLALRQTPATQRPAKAVAATERPSAVDAPLLAAPAAAPLATATRIDAQPRPLAPHVETIGVFTAPPLQQQPLGTIFEIRHAEDRAAAVGGNRSN